MKYSKRRKQEDNAASLQQDIQEAKEVSRATLTLDDALRIFLSAQHASGNSGATHKDYQIAVGNVFIRYMKETLNRVYLEEIEEVDIILWLSHLREATSKFGRPYSSRSIQTYYRDVVVFFKWLVAHKHLKENPAENLKPVKTEKALIRVFTEDELVRLDAACDRAPKGKSLTPDERKALSSRDRAFLWLLLSTGIRVSEACGLLFGDIEWDMGMIYVRGKGAKERKIPFGKIARQHLDTYIRYWRGGTTNHDEYVFLNAWGAPLRRSAAECIFTRLKKIAGIDDKRVSPHTCRHWFAVNAIKNGVPSTVLQGWLGHETLEMINTYVRLAEQDNRDLYVRFSPVDALKIHHTSKDKRGQLREWRKSRKGR
ncbi:tyrosine-type recombinase/integrase [Ktedonobacter racemifer]|uniref:Integrase family protein n=1 Tax=Ktedonobacter racemifer DSM 44963 TaxID=485913 RepID=D6TYY6_KTERA|nr:tyrosine-type recombinase/integrase [Ktedonobacter racemifer]EFH81776.1 integrase family protein [Ktedonobacter racemifer DSM 44963]